jgi:predicted nucleotidyltransferase
LIGSRHQWTITKVRVENRMAKKVSPVYEYREIRYAKGQWVHLERLRSRGLGLVEALARRSIASIVHGSLARGDVNANSDIDVFIPEVLPSYIVEGALAADGFPVEKRELTQATPVHTVKAIIHIDDQMKLAFPLIPLRGREREFYRFGGEVDLVGLRGKKRVPGIDKRLMLIVPTDYGHYELSVMENAAEAAKLVGVGMEIITERMRVLRRRDEVGRTGIYYKEELADGDGFEARLGERIAKDPSLRRLLQRRNAGFK